jgi:hypothetical protein
MTTSFQPQQCYIDAKTARIVIWAHLSTDAKRSEKKTKKIWQHQHWQQPHKRQQNKMTSEQKQQQPTKPAQNQFSTKPPKEITSLPQPYHLVPTQSLSQTYCNILLTSQCCLCPNTTVTILTHCHTQILNKPQAKMAVLKLLTNVTGAMQ